MTEKKPLPNSFLFPIPVLIWGSTWFAITFQLGDVEPSFSVSYRFILAGLLFITYCLIKGISLKFSLKDHWAIYIQSLFLFGLNYLFAYNAERFIASGLVAIVFSLVIFLNVIFGRLILGSPIRMEVVKGAVLGLLGTMMVFYPEVSGIEGVADTLLGLGLAGIAVVFASLGNIASAYNQRNELALIPSVALGMLYGGLTMFVASYLLGYTPSFDTGPHYVFSLLYLSVFGSILAFSAYLTLVGRMGADKAAYAIVLTPIIAVIVSMVFEDFELKALTAIGIVLIVAGNFLALRKR